MTANKKKSMSSKHAIYVKRKGHADADAIFIFTAKKDEITECNKKFLKTY